MLADRVPRKVAINEAVGIAKKFGNEDSSAFVNGILDRVANTLGAEKTGVPKPAGEKAKRVGGKASPAKAPAGEAPETPGDDP